MCLSRRPCLKGLESSESRLAPSEQLVRRPRVRRLDTRSAWEPFPQVGTQRRELAAEAETPEKAGARLGRLAVHLGGADCGLLDLVDRHPFLLPDQLARALGWPPKWARRRRNRLIEMGFLRLVEPDELPEGLAKRELAELTEDGFALVAVQQGLARREAARYNGLIGTGLMRSIRARSSLLKHIDHTVGANDVFIRLIETARTRAKVGEDDALIEWRNAPMCCRGRVRPDGYGIYRHRGELYGFFLEYDRGTEKARDYRQKFAAYYDYRASGQFERDYDGFPTILVVTPDLGPEQRIARAICAVGFGQPPLPVLLTTLDRIKRTPGGLLGVVWRGPDSSTRRLWLVRP